MESASSSPKRIASSRFKDAYEELIVMKVKAQHFVLKASTTYGPGSRVSFRSEELLYAIQRLDWELMRAQH
jgi:hypothetical protein